MTEKELVKIKTAGAPEEPVTQREGLLVWIRGAAYSFGGPAGQIAVMHRLIVEEKRWVGESRFLHALNYTMLLPGPEAQQLATYIGWLLHGIPGGLVAGGLFILPGFVSILVLSILYAGYQDLTLVQGLFFGLKPAVMAIVAEAVLRIGRRALQSRPLILMAALAFVAIFFFDIPFPLIIITAGGFGLLTGRGKGDEEGAGRRGETDLVDRLGEEGEAGRRSLAGSLRIAAVCLFLWFAPLVLLTVVLETDHVFTRIGYFFSQASVFTFGGAYAVLAYIAQEAVGTYGWLEAGEMLEGSADEVARQLVQRIREKTGVL